MGVEKDAVEKYPGFSPPPSFHLSSTVFHWLTPPRGQLIQLSEMDSLQLNQNLTHQGTIRNGYEGKQVQDYAVVCE